MLEPSAYRKKRPYRYQSRENAFLLGQMEQRFARPFGDYWEQFGYEIGGPVCYAYTRWLAEAAEREAVDALAFVARDGWLLRQAYSILYPADPRPSEYVYAPRSVCLLNQGEAGKDRYRRYLRDLGLGEGRIGVVDSVTMKFSSQHLISGEGERDTVGFYWCVLANARGFGNDFHFLSFQKEHYHTIRCWNLMEFILSSPEPPIAALDGGSAIYTLPTDSEKRRIALFPSLEKGVLSFLADAARADDPPPVDNREITEWVNEFLLHPHPEDITAFAPITFSERSDHADSLPLDPFGLQKKSRLKEWKDRLWFWSQEHPRAYGVLHAGKQGLLSAAQWLESFGSRAFRGRNRALVLRAAERADVISFDIFDTLLLRPYEKPTDLFRELERENGLHDFYDNRIQAEAFARASLGKPHGEIDLRDIYTLLAKSYGLDPTAMAGREVEKELAVCSPNPCFLPLAEELAAAGKELIAVSDMYLPSDVLQKLLDKNGFSMVRPVYVSNEWGAGKHDGSLQRLVWEQIGREKRVLHIGDNFRSDVKMSRAAGWDSLWYRK